jgi:NAD(P)-dependent dehydrogenase (short-subunit alcohol dehydrogenase family)
VKFESLEELNQDIGPSYLYNRSKLAQVLWVRAMKRRMEQKRLGFTGTEQVWINASHPGGVSTDQQEQAVEAYGTFGKVMVAATRPFMKEPVQQGCRPALFAATSEEIVKDKIQGAYVCPARDVDRGRRRC